MKSTKKEEKYDQEWFLKFNKEMHDKAHQITMVKNRDYSPGSNPFSNFEKLREIFGEDWPIKMITARLHEKLDRITNYAVKGKNKGNSEPIENDFIDLANYSFILLGYLTKNEKIKNRLKRP